MAQHSLRKTLARRAQRHDIKAGRRRRHLARRYPDVPAQAWSVGGDGLLHGAGSKALRAWLKSIEELALSVTP